MKVSIITATLNSAETIECALNSLKNQDYEDIEQENMQKDPLIFYFFRVR